MCVDAYLFGDTLADVDFQKGVLGLMITKLPVWENCVSEAMLAFIWKRMSNAVLLKAFVMLWVIAKYDKRSFARLAANHEVPTEFFAEAALCAANRVDTATPSDAQYQDMLRALLKDF